MKKITILLAMLILFIGCNNKSNEYTVSPITYNEISSQVIKDWIEKTTDDLGYHDYIY